MEDAGTVRIQQQLRYEAVRRREKRRVEQRRKDDEECAARALLDLQLGEDELHAGTDVPYEQFKALESKYSLKMIAFNALEANYKALEADYRLRMSELTALKEKQWLGRGFPSESQLEGDTKLTSFYTGLPNYSVLVSVFKLVNTVPAAPIAKLTNFQCFLLTLMKLRLNLPNYDLGFRFCVHETTVSRILIKWLQIMDVRLTPLIVWPTKENVQKTMPWCFMPQYGLDVTSIIDCFEIFIEKPSDLLCRAATWSNYKHYNTAKYLISVTPQGTVNYVSKGYGGRVSDKYITEDSGYLYKLQPSDVVLADRGFDVEDSVAYRGATLNIPAFTRGKPQLDPKDVEATRKLANVRIHVERVIGSVRQRFPIVSATTPLPTEYTRSKREGPVLLDSIVRVCCALHNVCDVIIPTT